MKVPFAAFLNWNLLYWVHLTLSKLRQHFPDVRSAATQF